MYASFEQLIRTERKKGESILNFLLEAFWGFIDENDDSEIYKSEVIQRDMKRGNYQRWCDDSLKGNLILISI